MKVDKEVLIKHHFWILLGVLIPLVLISMIVLWTATASAIEGKEKAYKDSVKEVQGISKPKNQKWLDALEVRAKEVGTQKNLIWGEAWERQKDLLTWPDELSPEDRQTLEKKYFAEEIHWKIREKYSAPDGPYPSQIPPIVSLVNPVNDKGEGMVQFKGGWEAIIPTFDLSKIDAKNRPIPSEELWILQEDLAVYRELLRIIKDVNEMVATFHKKVGGAPKPDQSKGEIDHQIFTNANWKLDLILAEQKNKKVFRGQVTNISQRRQPLGIAFFVKIKGIGDPQGFFVDGEPLPPGATIPVKDRDGNDQGLETQSGILEGEVLENVMQWFDWRTAPVKRIDKLALGYPSQRTAGRGLQTLKKWQTVKEDAAAQQQMTGGEDTGQQMAKQMGNIMGKGRMFGGGTGGGGFGGAASGDKTKDGLPKNRYVDISDQVRRMPIAMAVVIDQEHIADFLTVVANSKLRIQTTQVYWQRFHEDIKPKITKDEDKPAPKTTAKAKRTATTSTRMNLGAPTGGGPGFGGFDAGRMSNMMRNMQMRMGGARFGGGGETMRTGTTRATTTEESEEELDSNLVELGVHGIASLYERYPPPAEVAAAPVNP